MACHSLLRPDRFSFRLAVMLAALVATGLSGSASASDIPWTHAITRYGESALRPGEPFAYVNPNAPKGGVLRLGVQGTFDSLNQYIVQGAWTTTRGMRERPFGNNILESLMVRNFDEASTLYGLIAQRVRMPDDRSWIEYELNPDARFSDGSPVTVDDVMFSFGLIRDYGRPPFGTNMSLIADMEKTGPGRLKVTFSEKNNRGLPLAVSSSPIYARKSIDVATFDRSTLTPPLATGPYTFETIEPGRRVVYRKNPDYWAKDLPIMAGNYNFDEVQILYFRDATALREAFRKGEVDLLRFTDPADWEAGFSFPAALAGDVVGSEFDLGTPASMYGIAFNTRRVPFDDRKVRDALRMLFDFAWVNENFYFGRTTRTVGYWDNSDLSSVGRPAGPDETALLKEFADAVDPEVMAGTWRPADGTTTGRDRQILQRAMTLLQEAGYTLEGERLVSNATGEPLAFEILTKNMEEERLAFVYIRSLEALGIDVSVRTPDAAQFENRRTGRDFDIIFNSWSSGLSPGAEQIGRWSSEAADLPGSFNYVGAREPAIDAMLTALIGAQTEDDFVSAVRALDRVLISGAYAVPLFHISQAWVAHWTRVVPPAQQSLYGPSYDTWWSAEAAGTD